MSDEVKRPWQFSLGRALVAMTIICIALALARALVINASEGDFTYEVLALAVALMGFGSAVGVIVGGIKGAAVGAIAASAAGTVVVVA